MKDVDNTGGAIRPEAPLKDVLMSVSHEVRMLSDMASDLQTLVGNLVVAGSFGGSQSIYELQNLDRICQHLGAVADFVHGLAKHSSVDWKVDLVRASATIKLTEVSDRLTGRRTDMPIGEGDFDDFESWPLTG